MKELTAERLRELLHYDSETGHFTWRVQLGGARVGDIPRCFQRYYVLQIDSPTSCGTFSANIRIGVYKTPEEAEAAYLKVKRILHAGFRD